MRRPALVIVRVGRVVAKLGVLDQMPDDVDTEAVDTLAEPEPHHVIDRLANFRIAPVQVRLLGQEGMGFRYMMDQLNRNRTVIGARLTGTARWAQTQAAKRARERETFGKPLAERQAIQWMLAESEMDLEQSRYLDFPTLVLKLLSAGQKVMAFANEATWLDLGRHEDLMEAARIMQVREDEFIPREAA